MRKVAIACILVLSICSAETKDGIRSLIAKKEFAKACEVGQYIAKDSMDGQFLIEYGKACMHSDNLDMLSIVSPKLRGSKESREAAAIFETIQAQKKLLYLSLIDGISLKNIKMPKINHPLSIAFEHIAAGDYKEINGVISFNDGQTPYEIKVIKKETPPKLILIDTVTKKQRVFF